MGAYSIAVLVLIIFMTLCIELYLSKLKGYVASFVKKRRDIER